MESEWAKYAPDFSPEEVLSPDGLRALKRGVVTVRLEALDALQRFRTSVGYPLLVNFGSHCRRGYRSHAENRAVGGEEFSYHMQGVAFDISCPVLTIRQLYEQAIDFGWSGIGYYPERNFVHCDIRPLLTKGPVLWQL